MNENRAETRSFFYTFKGLSYSHGEEKGFFSQSSYPNDKNFIPLIVSGANGLTAVPLSFSVALGITVILMDHSKKKTSPLQLLLRFLFKCLT